MSIATCYGVKLTLPQMITIVLAATLASIGTAGVQGAGTVMLTMVLQSVGLPIERIALVEGVDRIFEMGRTTVNITVIEHALLCKQPGRKEKSKTGEKSIELHHQGEVDFPFRFLMIKNKKRC